MRGAAHRSPNRSRAPSDDRPGRLQHRDRDRAGDRACVLLLRGSDRVARVALLRAPVGEAGGELPDALHPRHPDRDRRRDRARGRLDIRPVRVMAGAPHPVGGAREPALEPRWPLDALDEVSEAVESGAGLPAVARAAGRALEASVIVVDSSSSVLAVACASPEDERAVTAGEGGTETVELL